MSRNPSLVAQLLIAFLLILRTFETNGQAETVNTETPADTPPDIVAAGVYLLGISDVDLRAGTCVADLWVWFRWKDAKHDPLEGLELIDGVIEARSGESRKMLEDGHLYATQRLKATIRQAWDVSHFPLDKQKIVIAIEDSTKESHEAVFVADRTNTCMSPNLRIPGWSVAPLAVDVTESVYETNYGDTSLPTGSLSKYSRFSAVLDLQRPGMGLFFKLFAGLFVAVGIALLALTVRPNHVDPRFGLPVGAMFAAIASEYVISAALPASTDFTLADQLHVLSMAVIFLTIVESVVSLTLFETGRSMASARLDMMSIAALAGAVIASVWTLVFIS